MNDITKQKSTTEVKIDPELVKDKNGKIIDTSGTCIDCGHEFLWISVNKRCRPCEIKANGLKPEPGEVTLNTKFSRGKMVKETKKKRRPKTSNIIIDMVRELKKNGATVTQAAKALHDAGHRSPTGKIYTSSLLTPIYYGTLKDVKRGKPQATGPESYKAQVNASPAGEQKQENSSPAPIDTHQIQAPEIETLEADIKHAIMKALHKPPTIKRFKIGDEIPYGTNVKLRVVSVEENVINFQPIVTLDVVKIEGTVEL